MEMYAKGAPFEATLTLQPHNNLRDVSFSSYLNKAEENMIRKLTNQAIDNTNDQHYAPRKKPEEDEEIGVFGAEKYFKGEIEDGEKKNDLGFIEKKQMEEFDQRFPISQRIDQNTPSIRSNVSWNSRSGLLPRTKQVTKIDKGSKTRAFLASFGCNCINKKSTQICEKQFIQSKEISNPQSKMFDNVFEKKTNRSSSNFSEKNTKNDYFSFPVLNSSDLNSNSNSNSEHSNSKSENYLAGKLTLGRKLSLLNDWDVEIPTEDEMYIPSSGMYKNDNDSDSSSDLFEIESFSTNGNSFFDHRKSNCAPSEVSVDWSVVTASAADFSMVSDYEEVKNSGGNAPAKESTGEMKKLTGILSGCVSQKAVKVAGGEFKVTAGGPIGRRRLSDSMAVGNLFRKGNNLMTRLDPVRGNYGSDVYPMGQSKGRHASQYLYVQQ